MPGRRANNVRHLCEGSGAAGWRLQIQPWPYRASMSQDDMTADFLEPENSPRLQYPISDAIPWRVPVPV